MELELVRSGGPTEVRVLRHVVVVDFVGSVLSREAERDAISSVIVPEAYRWDRDKYQFRLVLALSYVCLESERKGILSCSLWQVGRNLSICGGFILMCEHQ